MMIIKKYLDKAREVCNKYAMDSCLTKLNLIKVSFELYNEDEIKE